MSEGPPPFALASLVTGASPYAVCLSYRPKTKPEADRSKQASQTSVREGREAREQSPRDNTIYHFSASNGAEYRERWSHYDQELQGGSGIKRNLRHGRRRKSAESRAVVRNPGADIDNELSSVRSQSRNFENGIPLPEPVPSLPTGDLQQARKEVHDAMVQYTRVADPSEREAREERMRLAEDLGEMEETTTNMVQAAMHLSAEKHGRIEITDTPERIPAV
ncbi:hypothetical protein Bca101_047245 [Brassica carinata]